MENQPQVEVHLSTNSVLLKKMRILKKLSRQQAGIMFNVSFKTIEKLENGRGMISDEKLMTFAAAYGFTFTDLQLIKEGKIGDRLLKADVSEIPRDPKRRDRRFCQKIIVKECKVLRELRLMAGITQYRAGEVCGYNMSTIGHIENGRIRIPRDRIEHIVKVYGFTMQKFDELLASSELRHEVLDQCTGIINRLDDSKLRAVQALLLNFDR